MVRLGYSLGQQMELWQGLIKITISMKGYVSINNFLEFMLRGGR